MLYFWKAGSSRISNMTLAVITNTKTNTNTKTKLLKDPTSPIFLKMIWLKDIKYDDGGWISDASLKVLHQRWCTRCDAPEVMHHVNKRDIGTLPPGSSVFPIYSEFLNWKSESANFSLFFYECLLVLENKLFGAPFPNTD